MKGGQTLRICLGALEHSMVPLVAAGFKYRTREPENLDGLERVLIEHLADVEEALAHVRRMRISEAKPDLRYVA